MGGQPTTCQAGPLCVKSGSAAALGDEGALPGVLPVVGDELALSAGHAAATATTAGARTGGGSHGIGGSGAAAPAGGPLLVAQAAGGEEGGAAAPGKKREHGQAGPPEKRGSCGHGGGGGGEREVPAPKRTTATAKRSGQRQLGKAAATTKKQQAPADHGDPAAAAVAQVQEVKALNEEQVEVLKKAAARKKKVEEINERISRVMEEARSGPTSGGIFAIMKDQMRNRIVSPDEALRGRDDKMEVGKYHYILHNPMEGPWPPGMKVVVMASGCFWGSEKGFWRFPGGGVYSTAVGFAAGYTRNPTYNEVCSGRTGATEAVQVVYDPDKISLADLLRWFWESHDPTQGMGQGGDKGTQYRSGLYYWDDDQLRLMEASKKAYSTALRTAGRGQGPITTEIRAAAGFERDPGAVFYYAEDYHQQYLAKPGSTPYCSAEPQRVSLPAFETWAPPELASHAPKLPEVFWELHGPKPHCVVKAPDQPIKLDPSP